MAGENHFQKQFVGYAPKAVVAAVSCATIKMNDSKKFACVIWGGYAWGNTGDELCLAAALETVGRESGGPVAVLSHFPEYTQRLFPDATVIPFVPPAVPQKIRRWKRFRRFCFSFLLGGFQKKTSAPPESEWVRCLHQTRKLYLTGGGYLTDLFLLDLVMPPIELALKLKLPVTTAPIGLGPFTSSQRADQVVAALSQMKLKVRDQVSLDFCRSHHLEAALQPDDAFAWLERHQAAMFAAKPKSHPRKIGVCIFPQHGQAADCDLTAWWVEFLRRLNEFLPEYKIEGFCFHASLPCEFQAMIRLFVSAGLPADQVRVPTMDFRQATAALRDYDLIVSTRFHAVVAANVFQIPNVAIASGDYYQAKMQAAVSGYETKSQLVNPASLTPAELLEHCRQKLA